MEHMYRFDYTDFPYKLDRLQLRSLQIIDCAIFPYTYWHGKQVLAIYQ